MSNEEGFKYICETVPMPSARCPICDWPLKLRVSEGCVAGNCSYRPHEGTEEYRRIQARRKALGTPPRF